MFLITRAALGLAPERRDRSAWPEEPSGRHTVIGAELTVVGDIETDGHIEVEGRVLGTINGETVTVSETGLVEGSVLADSTTIRGAVEGRIQASTVLIGKNARVVGSVFHNVLTVEPGAHLEGRRPWRPHIDRKAAPTA